MTKAFGEVHRLAVFLVFSLISGGCAEGLDEAGPDSSGGSSSVGITGGTTATGGAAPLTGGQSGMTTDGTGAVSATGGGGGEAMDGASSGGSGGGGGIQSVPPSGDLVVQYRTNDEPSDNELKPQFNVVNRGTEAVPLAALTVRYFYTIDGSAPSSTNYQEVWLDYADIGRLTNGGTTAKVSFGRLESPQPGADHYIEVSFQGNDSLDGGQSTNQIEVRANWQGYTQSYDETDDYSWDATKSTFADSVVVTLYQNGTLIWGIEPDGTVPALSQDSGAPDAASMPSNPTDGGGSVDAAIGGDGN